MKRSLHLFLFMSGALSLAAQKENTNDPAATEVWSLKPNKITPGASCGEAPSDALVLFDGKNLDEWTSGDGSPSKWEVRDGAVTVVKGAGNLKTKKTFGDVQLHIEWRTPSVIVGEGQERGNSGIFLQGKYELQVLDSYESVTYSNGQAGAFYKQHIPLVNATRKPGEWQVYDIVYTAPHFGETGSLVSPARVTVLHNGVLIQNNVALLGPTDHIKIPVYVAHGKASLELQDHGNPVSYRNIWIREL
jgi:Domain of Unknown Function (DUF1080)